MPARRWLLRASVAGLVGAAALLAWVKGGGADARRFPPHVDPSSPASTRTASGGPDVYEARERLVEALGEATIEVPNLPIAWPAFQAYWRKLRGPWVHPSGIAGQLVTTLALRTNPQAEQQWEVASTTGPAWTPNVRVWNMNEGTFDQREAIFAPTPATLRFPLTVPPFARLRFSAAVMSPVPSPTIFDVSVVDAQGKEHPVHQTRVPPAVDARWVDVDVDLGAWSERKVELRLRTWMEKPPEPSKHAERPAPARSVRPAEGDAGAPDASSAAERPPPPPTALALWGDPVVVARAPAHTPYNVLWIVVDALRPDVAASLHVPSEDSAKLAALRPPLDALLPQVPGLMPSLDRLSASGVRFPHAWSAASWTRPGTLAMLTGERSSEVGIDTTNWVEPPDRATRYYASDPPLISHLLARRGVATAAFVNNFFMAGYAVVGLDMGFERLTDHRYRTRDTSLITYDTLAWLDAHAGDRFFLFVNYNSPHEPYDPPKEMLDRLPRPPAGPRDGQVRAYMAEAAKDDVAIGVLLDKLDALGLTASTLVLVTSDHGETLSSAHDGTGVIGTDKIPQRFHHAVGNFEETTRVPLVLSLPGVVDGGKAVTERVRSTDIAPTVLDIEGLEPDARMSGRSLLPLIRGRGETEPRVVVSEGRMSRAILWGSWRFVAHEAPAHPAPLADGGAPPPVEDELYDLTEDPGERRNLVHQRPDVVAEMRARLSAALADVPPADAPPAEATALPIVHVRFAGAGKSRAITGILTVGDSKHVASVSVETDGVPRESVRVAGSTVDFALSTVKDAIVGFDLRVDPPTAPIVWKWFLDNGPWPNGATFAGPFGLPAAAAQVGLFTDEARAEVYSPALPTIDPERDLGVFVTRDKADKSTPTASGPAPGGEGAKEMQQVLEQWGYAHSSH